VCALWASLWACLLILTHPRMGLAHSRGVSLLRSPAAEIIPKGPLPKNGFHFSDFLNSNGSSTRFSSPPRAPRGPRPRPQTLLSPLCKRVLLLVFIPTAGVVAYAIVPSTAHPLAGWPLFFLGTVTLLRLIQVTLGAPAAVYWLPMYIFVSMFLLGLPVYSALAFKLAAFFVLSFGGGVVVVLVVQSVWTLGSKAVPRWWLSALFEIRVSTVIQFKANGFGREKSKRYHLCKCHKLSEQEPKVP